MAPDGDEASAGPLGLGWKAGVVAVVLPQIPAQLGAGQWPDLVVVVLTGVAMAAVGLSASPRLWRAVVGLVVMVLVPFVSITLVDTPVFGPVVTSGVDAVADHRWASAYRLTDAVVRPDLTGFATTVSDSAHTRSVVTRPVTPILAAGDAGGRPVRVWLVDSNGRPSRAYPAGTVVTVARLIGWSDTGRRTDVQTVARHEGLVVARNILLVRPVDDPAAAWWSGWLKLAAIATVAGGVWTLLRRPG